MRARREKGINVTMVWEFPPAVLWDSKSRKSFGELHVSSYNSRAKTLLNLS